MPKLGDLGRNVDILRQMRDRLVAEEGRAKEQEVEQDRWDSFSEVASEIIEACDNRRLEELVTAVRKLKNRLRRPAVRKELAKLEADGGNDKIPAKKDKPITGQCKCAECGKVIDGSKEPCVEDALCTDCALKNRVVSKKEQDKKKKKKGVPPTPGMGSEGGGASGGEDEGERDDDEEKEKKESLRRRSYSL